MFGKINKHQINHHLNRAKNFLGHAYNHTKNFLHNVDHGVKTAKIIYDTVAPVLNSYGIDTGNKHINKALTSYDTIRNNVLENHDRVIKDVNNVKNNLAKKNVKFDFS
jgi:hypothetical protein